MVSIEAKPTFSLVKRAMGASGIKLKSLTVGDLHVSIAIVVSSGTLVEFGFGPMVIPMPSKLKT